MINANGALAGKIALVTGGTSGVGEASALLFAQEGAKVVITGRNAERGANVVSAIKKAGGEAVFFQGDVTQEEDVKQLIAFTLATYGRLDCAFNNAGITGPMKKLADLSLPEFRMAQEANVTSTWLCMKYEIQHMVKQGGGVIVNHASMSSHRAIPFASSYTASKHGVAGLTKTAALEYVENGIRVNAVCSGSVDTPLVRAVIPKGMDESRHYAMIPMRRFAQPSEIAELALWLASGKSSFVTGQLFTIDGGESAGRYTPGEEILGH